MTRCLDTHGSLDTLMRILATEAVCRVCILGLGNFGLLATFALTGTFALLCTLTSTLAGTGLLRRCCILGELDGLLRPLVAISPSMRPVVLVTQAAATRQRHKLTDLLGSVITRVEIDGVNRLLVCLSFGTALVAD